jgi:hypothetical protein
MAKEDLNGLSEAKEDLNGVNKAKKDLSGLKIIKVSRLRGR